MELASKFAPVLHFTVGEKFYPTSADYLINSSTLERRNADGSSTLVTINPTKYNLGSYSEIGLFLDNKLNTSEAIAADYASQGGDIGYYAYVRVVDSGTTKVIQYWLFYAFNNGPLNDHQGDIEVVQVFLDGSSNPQTALYSQHSAGENAGWGDVEKADTHPVVYVAQGSHANYFRSYQGRIGIENDIVGSDGLAIMPENLNLVLLGEENSHPADQSWLDYTGRWGFLGTEEDVALGKAGPLGPVFNQDGVRWAEPKAYLDSTFSVSGNYFILAWLAANFLLIFLVYFFVAAAWKIWHIVRLHKKSGLRVKKFLKDKTAVWLAVGVVAILITVVALLLPWYSISASSESGPLTQQEGVGLMSIDGINGLRVNTFTAPDSESTSGYRPMFFMQAPFALFIVAGLILLALDIIGIKSGKSIGWKFILGAVVSLLPFILIFIFIMELPAFLSWASSLLPGQQIPPQVENMVAAVAGNPIYGTASQSFPVAGTTTVSWGFGLGAYLFVVAAVMRIVAGVMLMKSPPPEERPVPPTAEEKQPAKETSAPAPENK